MVWMVVCKKNIKSTLCLSFLSTSINIISLSIVDLENGILWK